MIVLCSDYSELVLIQTTYRIKKELFHKCRKNMNIKDKILTKDLLIFDAHCDTANVFLDQQSYFIQKNRSRLSIDKVKKGGLKAQIFAIWVNPVYSTSGSI